MGTSFTWLYHCTMIIYLMNLSNLSIYLSTLHCNDTMILVQVPLLEHRVSTWLQELLTSCLIVECAVVSTLAQYSVTPMKKWYVDVRLTGPSPHCLLVLCTTVETGFVNRGETAVHLSQVLYGCRYFTVSMRSAYWLTISCDCYITWLYLLMM